MEHWESAKLHELVTLVIGGDWGIDPTIDHHDYVDVYCIRGTELRDWHTERGRTAAHRRIKRSSLEKRQLREGDLILEVSGGGPQQPVGRVERIDRQALAENPKYPKICTNFFRRLEITKEVDSSFLTWYLKYFYQTGEISAYQAGSSNLRNLNYPEYEQLSVPLPPLNEQHRIVERIETLFAQLDQGEAALRAVQALLIRYRQSVLKAAVTGQLTADWRGKNAHRLEHGRDLLARIVQNRRDTWQGHGKSEEMDAPDLADLPELPEGWVWATAEQLCTFITKGTTPPKGMDPDGERTIPFIRVTNLTDSGWLDLSDTVFVSKAVHKGFLARSSVYPGDVLMNIVGPPLGQVSVVPDDFPEWNINQAIAIFRALPGMSSGFLCIYLLSMVARDWLNMRAKTTAGQTNLTLAVCRSLPVPLPPVLEQDRIVSAFSLIAQSISELESAMLQGMKQATALRQSILTDAFAGRLVLQDPDDEPAAELLARIRAAREVAPKRNTRKKAKA